jgi:hypothetical protein
MAFHFRRALSNFAVLILSSLVIAACDNTPDEPTPPGDIPRPDAHASDANAPDARAAEAGQGGDDAAADARGDAGAPAVVGTLGEPCATIGALGCAGHDQKGQLICNPDHRWASNGVCEGTMNCDSRPGGSAGSCQPIAAECLSRAGGEQWCEGNSVEKCDADRVRFTTETCTVCLEGRCVDCAPGTKRCATDKTPTSCDARGHWTMLADCAAPTPVCLEGECKPCRPQEAICEGPGARVCGADGKWGNPTYCPYGCVAGHCVNGECSPKSLRCTSAAGGSPQFCNDSYKWETFSNRPGSNWLCSTMCSTRSFSLGAPGQGSNTDGYVVDAVGRKWENRSHDPATWAAASAACASNGRRLPTVAELESLKLGNNCHPNVDQVAFEINRNDPGNDYSYWSSDAPTTDDADAGSEDGAVTPFHQAVRFGVGATWLLPDSMRVTFRCVW